MCCKKFSCFEIIAFCTLILMLAVLVGLYAIHMRLAAAEFMPDIVQEYFILQEVLTVVYCLVNMLFFSWLIFNYCIKGKICSCNTFMYMLFGAVNIALGLHMCQQIWQ